MEAAEHALAVAMGVSSAAALACFAVGDWRRGNSFQQFSHQSTA
jgi:hypothetical protein